eukprot:1175870-Prorocentrum_minimum.AAC.5
MERTVKSDLCYSCTLGHLHCGGKLRRKKTVRKTGLGIIYCTGRIQNSYNNPSPALVMVFNMEDGWNQPPFSVRQVSSAHSGLFTRRQPASATGELSGHSGESSGHSGHRIGPPGLFRESLHGPWTFPNFCFLARCWR